MRRSQCRRNCKDIIFADSTWQCLSARGDGGPGVLTISMPNVALSLICAFVSVIAVPLSEIKLFRPYAPSVLSLRTVCFPLLKATQFEKYPLHVQHVTVALT